MKTARCTHSRSLLWVNLAGRWCQLFLCMRESPGAVLRVLGAALSTPGAERRAILYNILLCKSFALQKKPLELSPGDNTT